MIITFATQKGGAGKTTLAIAFANYISALSERKLNVFDFDYQKSFYHKWKEDELLEIPKLYDVEIIGEEEEQPFSDFETLINLKEEELNRYKNELLKLKSYLLDKIDQYPEIAKEITNDLSIVSREINTVNSISNKQTQISKADDSDIQLNVNDPDVYQDANQIRDDDQEQNEEVDKSRKFRR